MKQTVLKILTASKMIFTKYFSWKPLIRKTYDPQKHQNQLLLRILKSNRDTVFGRKYGFDKILSYGSFRSTVPVNEYEALRGYVEKQETEKTQYLNYEQPIMYAQTSGTTGKPKLIPILKSTVDQYRRTQHIVAYSIYKHIPDAYAGKVLAITSPAVEGVTESGTDYGAMSGLIYESMPALMRGKYVLPVELFKIENYEKKYYEIAKYGLAERSISMIATANPSTLVKLEEVINEHSDQLIHDISTIDSQRAIELKQLLSEKSRLVFRGIWPALKVVTIWTGGNCSVLIPELKKKLSLQTRIVELGYLSSEFRGGITIDVLHNRQIPAFHETFFEFVEKSDWENQNFRFLTLNQVEEGKIYYIFATTTNGLYRYNINDLVKITGWYNSTPTIEFVQKGKGVINLTGEKLCEEQLVQAMTKIIQKYEMDIRFFQMLGCPEKREYTLYLEHDYFNAREIERYLKDLNVEFREKRNSGRLKPLRLIRVLAGTGEAYKKHCIKSGQREGQFKMSYLQHADDSTFDFSNYLRERSDALA